MWELTRGQQVWSRRFFLLSVPVATVPALASKGTRFAPDATRYTDRATEFIVTQLTDPAYSSHLPKARGGRFISRRGDFLVFSSDRGGSLQAYSLDLDSGESRLLTEASALAADTLQLLPRDRDCVYFDGQRLESCRLGALRTTTLYEIPKDWSRGQGLSVSSDGDFLAFVETGRNRWRIRLLEMSRKNVRTAIGGDAELSSPQLRPRKPEVLFRKEGALWIAGYDGRRSRPLATAPGVTGPAMWTRKGGSLVYLNFPQEPGQLNTLREHFPDEGQDRLIAKTTQYVDFEPNADASVFVAVSGAKATPYILLMLRTTGRELALCEHRSSNPEAATPVFSPDSRRIFFEGDQGGKPAIYSMDVRRLVEATEDN